MIGECSRSCGTGTRTNNRTKLVEEANGGTCSGQPLEIVECNTQPCPGMIESIYPLLVYFDHILPNKTKYLISNRNL